MNITRRAEFSTGNVNVIRRLPSFGTKGVLTQREVSLIPRSPGKSEAV
jgi:hypothetical protein